MTDEQRINWPEAKGHVGIGRFKRMGESEGRAFEVSLYTGDNFEGATLREAIDAAMKGEANETV